MIGHMNDHTDAIIKRTQDGQTWYVVATALGMMEAEIIAGSLRTAGIPVYLFREAAGAVPIPLSYGLGGVEVAVPEAYYEEALALLEPDDKEPPDLLPPGLNLTDEA